MPYLIQEKGLGGKLKLTRVDLFFACFLYLTMMLLLRLYRFANLSVRARTGMKPILGVFLESFSSLKLHRINVWVKSSFFCVVFVQERYGESLIRLLSVMYASTHPSPVRACLDVYGRHDSHYSQNELRLSFIHFPSFK